jgi:hypothetical protein
MLADPPRAGNRKRPMTCAAKPIETTYLDKYNTDSTARLSLDSDRTWRAIRCLQRISPIHARDHTATSAQRADTDILELYRGVLDAAQRHRCNK